MTERRGGADELLSSEPGPANNEFLNFAALLRRRKWLIAAVTLVTLGLALGVTLRERPTYAASALLQVGSTSADASGQTDRITAAHNRAVSTVAIITSEGYREVAAKAMGVAADTLRQVSASAGTDTDLIHLGATAASPGQARQLAQSYADHVVAETEAAVRDSVTHQVALLQERYDALSTRIAALETRQVAAGQSSATVDQLRVMIGVLRDQQAAISTQIALAGPGTVTDLVTLRVVSPATASSVPVSPRVTFTAAIALAVGLLLGLVLAWVQDQLDRTIRSIAEVEQRVGGPVLALVPLTRPSDVLDAPAATDAYSYLRVNLGVALAGATGRVLATTSARDGEGKTTTVIGLGRSLAGAGRHVLVIDADLRRRGLSRALGVEAAHGLTEYLQGTDELEDVVVDRGDVKVLPSGAGVQQNAAALLDSARFESLLQRVRAEYDYVLIDSTPARMLADAVLVAQAADAVLVVARLGMVGRDEFSSTIAALRDRGSDLVGCVVYAANDAGSPYYAPTPKRRWSRILTGGRASAR